MDPVLPAVGQRVERAAAQHAVTGQARAGRRRIRASAWRYGRVLVRSGRRRHSPAGGAPAGNVVAADMAVGSTVTASWMLRPSSRDSACVISARSRVSSCSLTNSFGVAISAVFSTSPSGRVSLSQAR